MAKTRARGKAVKTKTLLSGTAFLIALMSMHAFSQPNQQGGPNDSPSEGCRADLGVATGKDANTESLSEQLDRCNGVLRPPRIGDQELVEPAPDVGTMPIIPPGALPDQSSAPQENDEISRSEKAIDAGSGIDQIVGLMANSSTVADKWGDLKSGANINIVNISIVFRGAKSEVLKTALLEHEKGIEQLRSVLSANQSVMSELAAKDTQLGAVVAADVEGDGSLTIFVR